MLHSVLYYRQFLNTIDSIQPYITCWCCRMFYDTSNTSRDFLLLYRTQFIYSVSTTNRSCFDAWTLFLYYSTLLSYILQAVLITIKRYSVLWYMLIFGCFTVLCSQLQADLFYCCTKSSSLYKQFCPNVILRLVSYSSSSCLN